MFSKYIYHPFQLDLMKPLSNPVITVYCICILQHCNWSSCPAPGPVSSAHHSLDIPPFRPRPCFLKKVLPEAVASTSFFVAAVAVASNSFSSRSSSFSSACSSFFFSLTSLSSSSNSFSSSVNNSFTSSNNSLSSRLRRFLVEAALDRRNRTSHKTWVPRNWRM